MRPLLSEGDRLKYLDPKLAAACYMKSISIAPLYHFTIVSGLVKIGECYQALGETELGLQYCTLALRLNPTEVRAHVCCAKLYEELLKVAKPRQDSFLGDSGGIAGLEALQYYVNAFVLDGSRSMQLSEAIDRVSRVVGQYLARDSFYARDPPEKLPSSWLIDSFFAGFSTSCDIHIKGVFCLC